MPSELRRIVFSNDELRRALDTYLPMQRVSVLPPGRVSTARFDPDSPGALVLTVHDALREQTEKVSLNATIVAAALIRYCFMNKVPLPKTATKALVISGDNVALDVQSAAVLAGAA